MDPSSGSFWSRHLLAECARTLTNIPFDGLHIDQYGDPKQVWDSHQNVVDLPRAFADFIQSASHQHPGRTILFNAVGNWPVEALAESDVHFLYIEVWPPDVEYRHLAEIVLNAVGLSHGKAVVIALYLPARRTANNLLADGIILACGGTRIELGEEARLLSDPYFPRHEEVSPELQNELQRLADFTIRNGEWLRPYTLSSLQKQVWSNGELNSELISIDNGIWTVMRNYPKSFVVQFINFSGLDPHQRWDEAHVAPTAGQDVSVKIQTPHCPTQVFWDCPEQMTGPQALHFEYSEGMLTFQIPHIQFIGLVAIHE
jgi:dextranase